MKFEEAMCNLRDNKILTRLVWNGKRIEFKNNEFNVINQKPSVIVKEKWNPEHDDIAAQDWTIIDPDDLKEFLLSANQLKELGIRQSEIDKLKGSFKKSLPEHMEELIDVNEFI